VVTPAARNKRIAVVGAGPAGLAFSTTAAERGHDVTLFDAATEIGGQFNLAKQIPGKEEFYETLRYFENRLKSSGVTMQLNSRQSVESLVAQGFDEVVLATGVHPRAIDLPSSVDGCVVSYKDVLEKRVEVGNRVAIIGAGGIGFDIGEYLSHAPTETLSVENYLHAWGIDPEY
jgi:2,4-dienoyl-CoA reductase (NADPH2)